MIIERLSQTFSICKVMDTKEIDMSAEFCFVGKTDCEISLVCPSENAPETVLEREDGWRAFRIKGILDFSLVGVLSKISSVLAERGIGILAVSTFNTDYIFVKADDFEASLDALAEAGYEIK